ncbi:MAG: hypothetical protein JW818_07265 [Pirellulales bacterium]|nr:hypothetical protein [Pirellulales bacterium]
MFDTVTDPGQDADLLRRGRYGVIETRGGELVRIRLRPFPKLISAPEVLLLGGLFHRHRRGDWCRLYYAQPWRFPNFLAIQYIVSAHGTSYRTFRRAVEAVDEIARIKQSDALLCELTAPRLTGRIMERWGWESHCPSRWRRHYIKRFYGTYPARPAWLGQLGNPGS